MFDENKNLAEHSLPSESVSIIGLDFLAEAGEKFLVINDQDIRAEIIKLIDYHEKNKLLNFSSANEDKKNINLVIIADSKSSLEVLEEVVRQKSLEITTTNLQIIYKKIGVFDNFAL